MHCKWYVCDVYKKDLTELSYAQLEAVALLHDRHYIHRNIKPSNFTIWAGVDGITPAIFLIDFGLAHQFRNPTTYLHIPYTTQQGIIGTLLFVSINGQQGHIQLRYDDLESLAYTITFLVHGNLPWTATSICEDHDAVLQKKVSVMAAELCQGLPPLFSNFITYVHSLGFNKKLDYQHLHTILLQCLETKIDQHSMVLPSTPPHCSANHTPSHSDHM